MIKELHILQHSLGVDQYGLGVQYRNHFATGEGSVDWPLCNALVDLGHMGVRRAHPLAGNMDCFWVTDAGREWMTANSPPPPRLSRSQKRYLDFLDADCFETFGQYLRHLKDKKNEAANR